ncbi:MAG: uroporphyrinogen decarboxylase family protein [Lachnospiraceae bacterium]|jgi:hypothetical protein
MNKRERVLTVFNNHTADRIPAAFWYHFSPDADEGELTVKKHLDLYREADFDLIKIMCDGFFNYPNPQIAEFTEASDWNRLKPLGPDHPWITRQVKRAEEIVKQSKGECCVFYNVFNPMSLLRFQTSYEKLMHDVAEDPQAVKNAFAVVGEDVRSLIRGLIVEAGCDGVYYCVQNAETFRFTADQYRSLVTPAELEALQYANSMSENNILHCCGWAGDKNRIEVWQDYPAKCVNWAVYTEGLSLSEGRKFFGGKAILGGFKNTKDGVLYSGSKEEVKAEAKKIVREAGSDGLIVGADCTVPSDISHERFLWVREALDEITPAGRGWAKIQ